MPGKTEEVTGVDNQGNIMILNINNPLWHSKHSKVNENYVKTKIDSMCGCPKKEKMEFYSRKDDETIGNMLKKLCKDATVGCENCKEPMYKHF